MLSVPSPSNAYQPTSISTTLAPFLYSVWKCPQIPPSFLRRLASVRYALGHAIMSYFDGKMTDTTQFSISLMNWTGRAAPPPPLKNAYSDTLNHLKSWCRSLITAAAHTGGLAHRRS